MAVGDQASFGRGLRTELVLRSKGAAFTPPEGAVKNCETARVRVAVEACILTATCLAQVANAME